MTINDFAAERLLVYAKNKEKQYLEDLRLLAERHVRVCGIIEGCVACEVANKYLEEGIQA